MNRYFIDCDGVILDSIGIVCAILSKRDNTFYNPKLVKTWNMDNIIPYSNSEVMNEIFNSQEFWDMADDYILEGAKEFILKNIESCVICSLGTITNQIFKLDFIRRNFGEVDCLPIITNVSHHPLTIDKSYIKMGNGDLLIEDSYKNILMCQAEYNILFNNYSNWKSQWSHDWDADKTQQYYDYTDRATNWDEVSKIVEWIDRDRFISSY
jgi:hypothetical protein